MDSREPREDHELAECWTCRERNFCEITHSSNDHPGKLFRCINCKAVYPDFALRRPSPVAESTPTAAEIATVTVGEIKGVLRDKLDLSAELLADMEDNLTEVAVAVLLKALPKSPVPTDATAVEAEREAIEAAIEDLIPWSPGTESRRGFPSPREIADAVLTAIRSRTPKES